MGEGDKLRKIGEIASGLGINEDEYEPYGPYMAKVSLSLLRRLEGRKNGKLILVTGTSPTPAGEGKTTTTIGVAQAMRSIGKSVSISLREPSLGPCFGIKGGATGGGKSTVQPSDRINLFFTSDFPAVSTAHNLLSAMINNHIHHGNRLNLDPKNIVFPRTIDMNDRSLRNIIVGVGDKSMGEMMTDHYVITPASEIMAILALSSGYEDLKKRLGNILIGFDTARNPVYARDIRAEGAMAALLGEALKPNLVQTVEGVPAFIHAGPFGNIAHGTSSILAAKTALKLTDYVFTEAGFGSDLGAQKFFDFVTQVGGLDVHGVILVTSIRALKHQGGAKDATVEDVESISSGMSNLMKHVGIVRSYGFRPLVAINQFDHDTEAEKNFVTSKLDSEGVKWAFSTVFRDGGKGGVDMANRILELVGEEPVEIRRKYQPEDDVETKIRKVATQVYGASDVDFTPEARKNLRTIKKLGLSNSHICMAKTQYSLSDNPKLLGSPENFTVKVTAIRISNGAGFVVPYLGDIMTMPGLPAAPAAEEVSISDDGVISGL